MKVGRIRGLKELHSLLDNEVVVLVYDYHVDLVSAEVPSEDRPADTILVGNEFLLFLRILQGSLMNGRQLAGVDTGHVYLDLVLAFFSGHKLYLNLFIALSFIDCAFSSFLETLLFRGDQSPIRWVLSKVGSLPGRELLKHTYALALPTYIE